jgi:hypothetical protein
MCPSCRAGSAAPTGLPKGRVVARPTKISATFGAPMTFGDRPRSKGAAQQIANDLLAEILRL